MKKLTALILALCMLMICSAALADTAWARLNQRIATRTGPGTFYFEPGSFLTAGDDVLVHTKVWDSRNEIWWVQVEFTSGGESYRAYTGSWRMNVNLSRVPQERALGTVRVTADTDAFAGPGWGYVMWNDTVYRGTTATLYEVEGGYALIECWNNTWQQTWRVWVDLDDLSCRNVYSNHDDTHPSSGSTSTNNSWNNNTSTWPVGQTCLITASGGNARTGAGTQYGIVGYVENGDMFTVLDTKTASNGVTWYKVNVNGRYGWISSGLTNFGKH